MKQIKKIGGISAIILTLIYIIGIVMNVTMLDMSGLSSDSEKVLFVKENLSLMYAWISLLYIVFGIVLVPLVLSLYQVFKDKYSQASAVAAVFGFIWSALVLGSGMVYNLGMLAATDMYSIDPEQAGLFFKVIETVHVGLGGGIEIVGAVWMLMIALMAYKTVGFNKIIQIIGIVAGVSGILTLLQQTADVTIPIFAFGQMIWWIGLGLKLIKDK